MKVGRREFLKLAGSAMAITVVPVKNERTAKVEETKKTETSSGDPSWRPVRNVLTRIHLFEPSCSEDQSGIVGIIYGRAIDIHDQLHDLPLGKHVRITRDGSTTRFYTDGRPGIEGTVWNKLRALLEPEERGTREATLRDVDKAFERIECPDPNNYGKFITIGTVGEMHTGIWRKPHGR